MLQKFNNVVAQNEPSMVDKYLKILLYNKRYNNTGKWNLEDLLILAVYNNRLDIVKYFVEVCNFDVNVRGSVRNSQITFFRVPPINCAAIAGHFEILKYLVKSGANVNSIFLGRSPLLDASEKGYFEIVKHLIEYGADIELYDLSKRTSFWLACRNNHKKIIRYLFDNNANINAQDRHGSTPLHDCVMRRDLITIKLLVGYGADVNIKNVRGFTPLILACMEGHRYLVEYFVSLQS